MDKIKERVKHFIIESLLMGADAEIRDDTSFLEQSLLDSTGILELVAFLEESFQIEVADEELSPENLDSLNAIEAFVTAKQAAAQVSS